MQSEMSLPAINVEDPSIPSYGFVLSNFRIWDKQNDKSPFKSNYDFPKDLTCGITNENAKYVPHKFYDQSTKLQTHWLLLLTWSIKE